MPNLERHLAVGGRLFAGILLLTSYGAAKSSSPTLTTLSSFGGFAGDGNDVLGGVAIGRCGVLYGTTNGSGTAGLGTVFSLTPVVPGGAWTEAVLYSFTGGECGENPKAGVAVGGDGVLYGTTYAFPGGTVFSLTPPATAGGTWTHRVLYRFGNVSDGTSPTAGGAIGSGGVLYGTTSTGGSTICGPTYGCGTVFSLTPPASPGGAWTENVLVRFDGTTDGANPAAGVVFGSGGLLYGTTSSTIFSLTPPTSPGASWTEAVLYTVTTGDEGGPLNGVAIGGGGVLYGTTFTGGTFGSGTVFSLSPPESAGAPWTRILLHSFSPYKARGSEPVAGVVTGPHVVLYGTAGPSRSGYGVLFALEPPGSPGESWKYRLLHSFTESGTDGGWPKAAVAIGGDALYGTTSVGGAWGMGTVFSYAR